MATNNASSDIEILVGVQGGESISDGSGQLISATLKKIASHISQQQLIKITVGADLRTSKNSIQKTLNKADIKIHNIGFGENVSRKLQGQLAKMGFSIDIDANLKEAEKKEQTSDKKTGSRGTRIRKPKDIDYLSQNEKTADKFRRTLSRISSKNGEIVMSAERVAKAYAEAEEAVDELANSSEKYDSTAIGHIEGLIDRLKISVSDEIREQKKAIKEASGSSGAVITAKNSQNQTIVDSQLKKLDDAIVNSGAVAQTDAVQQKYAELRAEIQRCADSAEAYGHEQEIALKRAVAGISDVIKEQRKIAKNNSADSINKAVADSKSALANFDKYLQTLNPKVFTECAGEIENIKRLLRDQTPEAFKQAEVAIKSFKAQMKNMGYEGGNILTFLEGKIKTFAVYLVSSELTSKFAETLLKVGTTVIDLDAALTDLRIVTGGTREETKKLLATYNDMAQELGATTVATTESAVEWQRQGYNIKDTNELIKDSMVLSVVGMVDSADAAQYLTSAVKGYKVEVSDAMGIVDKLTSVDLKAAVSAGGLAEAMARTANSARQAGVDMNSLIGYIAAVGEVTQRDMSTVGEAFKSIFARYGNVKLGKLIDDESGESLNDFETALSAVGISLRNQEYQFRDFNDVMIELGKSYQTMSDVERSAIATTLGGVRQRENVLVLLENLDKAFGYAETAANSAGTAMQKFAVYEESVEHSAQKMTAAFEKFSSWTIDSSLIKGVYDLAAAALNAASAFPSWIKDLVAFNAALLAASAGIKAFKASTLGTSFSRTFEDLGWPKKTGDIVPIYSKKAA